MSTIAVLGAGPGLGLSIARRFAGAARTAVAGAPAPVDALARAACNSPAIGNRCPFSALDSSKE